MKKLMDPQWQPFEFSPRDSWHQNATGALTRNVFANDVRLTQNTTTPGNGDEPG